MPRTAHRFPLNLADPCTRGWGGAYLNPSHASYWVIVTALLLPSMYDATIGPFLTPWVGLWLPLWCAYGLFLYLRRLAYFNPRYAPRPRVVCDPRGITLHDAFGRIRYQWRWTALADVRYQRGMQHGLLLEPQQGESICYRSGYLDYPDYHDIVATAQRYLRGGAPPLQPVIPPPDLDHCWYERRDGYAFYSLIYWQYLVVLWTIPDFLTAFLQWPEDWHKPPPTALLNAFYPFLVAGGIALGVFIILVIVREYRAACAATPRILRVADGDGLHIHHRNGRILSLRWQDIRDATLDEVEMGRKNHRITHRVLDLHDRLGHSRRIRHTLFEEDDDDRLGLAETVALIDAIREGKKPLPLRPPMLTTTPLTERLLFWPNTLWACLAIPASIQVNLGVETWLTAHHEDILWLAAAQGLVNLIVPILCLIIRRK